MKDLFFLFASDITSHIYSNPVHIVLGGVHDRSSLDLFALFILSVDSARSLVPIRSIVRALWTTFVCSIWFYYMRFTTRSMHTKSSTSYEHTHTLTTYSPASGTSNIMNEQFKCEIFHFEQFNHCWVACTITTFRSWSERVTPGITQNTQIENKLESFWSFERPPILVAIWTLAELNDIDGDSVWFGMV